MRLFQFQKQMQSEKNQKQIKTHKIGKKSRAIVSKEYGKVFAMSLASYMEQKKSDLKKLQRSFYRKQKQEEYG